MLCCVLFALCFNQTFVVNISPFLEGTQIRLHATTCISSPLYSLWPGCICPVPQSFSPSSIHRQHRREIQGNWGDVSTFSINTLDSRVISTKEPENVKPTSRRISRTSEFRRHIKTHWQSLGRESSAPMVTFGRLYVPCCVRILSEIKWAIWGALRNKFLA